MKWLFASCLALASMALLLPPAVQQDLLPQLQQEAVNVVSNPPLPPGSVSNPPSPTTLAQFSWQLFIWANQGTAATIQNGSQRSTPSTSFINAGRSPLFNRGANPLIFEGLYHRTEAYPYFTGFPPPFPPPVGQAPIYRFQPINGTPFTVMGGNYVNLDETDQIGQNSLYYRRGKDPNFPVLFMAKVNATEVSYAWDRTLSPSNSTSWVFPNGVLEIKAAWRRVRDFPDFDGVQSRIANTMHQAIATYYVGEEGQTPTVQSDVFALLALHIIQKSAGYPSFIFTTFENVNAVMRQGSTIVDPAFQLAYNTLQYEQGNSLVASPKGAYTINAPGQSGGTNAVQNYNLPAPGPQAAAPPNGYQVVVQPKTITSEVNYVNNIVRDWILRQDPNSVWANYRLKGVQAVPTSDQTTLDYYLANIVVESSQPGIQLFRGGTGGQDPTTVPNTATTFYNTRNNIFLAGFPRSTTGFGPSTTPTPQSVPGNISMNIAYNRPVPTPQYVMGGCMGCHGVAQQFGGDFSFLAAAAGQGKPVGSVPPSDLTPQQLMENNQKLHLRRAQYLFHRVP